MKFIRKNLYSLLFVVVFVFFVSISVVGAQWEPPVPSNIPTLSLSDIILNAINWAVGIVALVSIIVIVIAGFLWATAGSEETRVENARKWIIGAVGGLIVALAAWAIVTVVTGAFFAGN